MLFQRRVRLGSRLLATATAIISLAGAASAASPPAAPPCKTGRHPPPRRCADVAAYCGDLDRPLDPAGTIPGRVSVHFEFYLHRNLRPAVGTLVATEGGPGYPATLSRDDYLDLFNP
jgi:hypothetical protein